MTDYIVERRFEKARDLLEALTPWAGTFGGDEYIFRGHSSADYYLSPTSIRVESIESIRDYSRAAATIMGSAMDNDYSLAFVEYQLIRDFYKFADARGLHVPASDRLRKMLHADIDLRSMYDWVDGDMWLPEDMLEVAALAQHYGIATRLLDWTYDPFVAAFFASRPSSRVERELCIWGLNISLLGKLDMAIENFPLRLVTPHYSGNPNLAAQSGLFTHWASSVPGLSTFATGEIKSLPPVDRRPLDVLLKDFLATVATGTLPGIFVKMVLPGSESSDLARLLRKFGYGPARLFPGYEGVAMEMKERPFLKTVR